DSAIITQLGESNTAVVEQADDSYGNSISINQNGLGNFAAAGTRFGSGSQITIDQQGTHNVIMGGGNTPSGYGDTVGAGTWGADNILMVSQDGTGNRVYADAAHDQSTVDISQQGDFNEASVESWWGEQNDITVAQTGESHVTDVHVYGGVGNHVSVTQYNVENTAIVTSTGSHNSATIIQGSMPQ
ncbi:hypothetical protein ACVBKF_21230, partial [Shewanella sp. 0m-11]